MWKQAYRWRSGQVATYSINNFQVGRNRANQRKSLYHQILVDTPDLFVSVESKTGQLWMAWKQQK